MKVHVTYDQFNMPYLVFTGGFDLASAFYLQHLMDTDRAEIIAQRGPTADADRYTMVNFPDLCGGINPPPPYELVRRYLDQASEYLAACG